MNNEVNAAKARFEELIQVHQLEWNLSIGIFIAGVVIFSILVQRKNNLSLKDTLLAIVGLKSFERSLLINLVNALTILVPVAIMAYVFSNG